MAVERLAAQLCERILVLDGAMGTMLQKLELSEAEVRGQRFRDHPHPLALNYDLLVLTRSDIIAHLHHQYLEAGADLIQTNTFSSTSVGQADYGLESLSYELNLEAARLARRAADEWSDKTPHRPRFVAGTVGPTIRPLSARRNAKEAQLTPGNIREVYREQARGLIDGGVDVLLVETIVDPLHAQAALAALRAEFDTRQRELPMMISATATKRGAQTMAGQSVEAFYALLGRTLPFSVGLNCSFGVGSMRSVLTELSTTAATFISCHPSAGLPNAEREYGEGPQEWAEQLHDLAVDGLLNIAGGCCGTTPEHVRALASLVKDLPPRPVAASLLVKAQCSEPDGDTG